MLKPLLVTSHKFTGRAGAGIALGGVSARPFSGSSIYIFDSQVNIEETLKIMVNRVYEWEFGAQTGIGSSPCLGGAMLLST
jgi:hypothetical protein